MPKMHVSFKRFENAKSRVQCMGFIVLFDGERTRKRPLCLTNSYIIYFKAHRTGFPLQLSLTIAKQTVNDPINFQINHKITFEFNVSPKLSLIKPTDIAGLKR